MSICSFNPANIHTKKLCFSLSIESFQSHSFSFNSAAVLCENIFFLSLLILILCFIMVREEEKKSLFSFFFFHFRIKYIARKRTIKEKFMANHFENLQFAGLIWCGFRALSLILSAFYKLVLPYSFHSNSIDF